VATGVETVLHSFDGSDGQWPVSSLTLSQTGTVLYGTAGYGLFGSGVVFAVTKAGIYKLVHSFTGADGATPTGALALDSGGNIYGAAQTGGVGGGGTVFKIAPKTAAETVLYSFTAGPDGGYPQGGIIRSKAGNLYGTTYGGGANGYGTAFELINSAETVLHSFYDLLRQLEET